jgi:ABC-2 type transport system ATP-binding protein
MNQNAIEIRALEKSFGTFRLGPIDLTVPQGAIYGLVGPNGAGKTTTIDLIFGMGNKDAGSIKILGCDHIRDEVEMKRKIGYVSPDLNFQAWGKVKKLLQFAKGFYPSWDDDYCRTLLQNFGVGPDERIAALSFGSKTKLALIVALSWHPQLLILDEPTVGVDAVSKRQIFSELLAVVKNEERTVFISSHSLADLERFTDHIGMIRNGRMLFEGTTADIIDRFKLVDVVTENGFHFSRRDGVYVQKQEHNRCQILVDTQRMRIETLGAQQISVLPVTLEDVFVALARE